MCRGCREDGGPDPHQNPVRILVRKMRNKSAGSQVRSYAFGLVFHHVADAHMAILHGPSICLQSLHSPWLHPLGRHRRSILAFNAVMPAQPCTPPLPGCCVMAQTQQHTLCSCRLGHPGPFGCKGLVVAHAALPPLNFQYQVRPAPRPQPSQQLLQRACACGAACAPLSLPFKASQCPCNVHGNLN